MNRKQRNERFRFYDVNDFNSHPIIFFTSFCNLRLKALNNRVNRNRKAAKPPSSGGFITTGPRAQAEVKPEDFCKEYATPIECDVRSVCCTSVDCAKYRMSSLSVESINACLKKETRSTVRKMLESRLRKLEKN